MSSSDKLFEERIELGPVVAIVGELLVPLRLDMLYRVSVSTKNNTIEGGNAYLAKVIISIPAVLTITGLRIFLYSFLASSCDDSFVLLFFIL